MGLSAAEAGELAEPAPCSQWAPASVMERVPGQASCPRPRSPQSLRRTGSCSPRYGVHVSPSHGKDRLRAGSTLSVGIGVDALTTSRTPAAVSGACPLGLTRLRGNTLRSPSP